jgi:hypothetical protein
MPAASSSRLRSSALPIGVLEHMLRIAVVATPLLASIAVVVVLRSAPV